MSTSEDPFLRDDDLKISASNSEKSGSILSSRLWKYAVSQLIVMAGVIAIFFAYIEYRDIQACRNFESLSQNYVDIIEASGDILVAQDKRFFTQNGVQFAYEKLQLRAPDHILFAAEKIRSLSELILKSDSDAKIKEGRADLAEARKEFINEIRSTNPCIR